MSSLPPVEETPNKGRVWNGFVCPGCRTVFRVAADFDGREVICPTCKECLKLPEKRPEAPPLVAPKPEVPATVPPAPVDDTAPEPDEPVPTGLPQRRKLAFTLAVPLIAAIALILVLTREKGDETSANHSTEATGTTARAATAETPTPAQDTDEPEPVESAPEISTVAPPALPKPLEILESAPPAAPSENPPVASVIEPTPLPEVPPAPLLPDPEDGLVAAVPDTPGALLPPPPGDADESGEYLIYVVRSGDTLGKLAQLHNVPVDEIMHANRMRSDLLHAGQTLRIPVDPKTGENQTPPAAAEPETEQSAQTDEAEENPTASENSVTEEIPAPQEKPEPIRYTVVRGDNLTRLARQYGCEPADIMRLNGLKNDVIRLGEELLIPPPAN